MTIDIVGPNEYTLKGQFILGLIFGIMLLLLVIQFYRGIVLLRDHLEELEEHTYDATIGKRNHKSTETK